MSFIKFWPIAHYRSRFTWSFCYWWALFWGRAFWWGARGAMRRSVYWYVIYIFCFWVCSFFFWELFSFHRFFRGFFLHVFSSLCFYTTYFFINIIFLHTDLEQSTQACSAFHVVALGCLHQTVLISYSGVCAVISVRVRNIVPVVLCV